MSTDYKELESRYAIDIYPKRDLTIVRGAGASLWDDAGREYIDCAAGIGVASVGHANPMVAKAIADQASTLITCPSIFYNDTRAMLLERLVKLAPAGLEQAFLCNSGTEAMEAALKFARHATGRKSIISAMRGYHGRTMGALSATHKKEYRTPFEPLPAGFSYVPYNNIDKLTAAVTDDTAAIVLEPVQGEGGIRPGNAEYFQAVRKLCDERGILLILDEVQTGFCRTGKMFGCEHFDVAPDILCVAKAMAGGVPMGAVLANSRVKDLRGLHGSTFGGNPLACAAALAALDFMETEGLAERSQRLGDALVAEFIAHKPARVRDVRHLGLMIGIELKERVQPFLVALMDKGVLALPAGPTVLRLLPPLVIEESQVSAVVAALHEVLAD
ncbi:MAG: acetylornithine/succinylornithine family transaminase [Chromatiales bacterium]|jgi:LysW-gamma-L-lysine/LysW-L-ornithine aminotransferase|nr:acetylornithine/succinylornithine family transaminase [Chromatiales bacterium]